MADGIIEIRGNQKVILNEFKNLKGWMKEIADQVKLTNGTVRYHDTDIALLKQWKKIKEKTEDKLEAMTRGKFLVILTAILTVGAGILIYLIKRTIENALG